MSENSKHKVSERKKKIKRKRKGKNKEERKNASILMFEVIEI